MNARCLGGRGLARTYFRQSLWVAAGQNRSDTLSMVYKGHPYKGHCQNVGYLKGQDILFSDKLGTE